MAQPAGKAPLERECTPISPMVCVQVKGTESCRQLESSQEMPHLVEYLLKGRLTLRQEEAHPPATHTLQINRVIIHATYPNPILLLLNPGGNKLPRCSDPANHTAPRQEKVGS